MAYIFTSPNFDPMTFLHELSNKSLDVFESDAFNKDKMREILQNISCTVVELKCSFVPDTLLSKQNK